MELDASDRAHASGPTRSTKTSGSTTRPRSRPSSPCATTPRPQKLEQFAGELQDIENHLPIDPKLRNPKLGALAPIRVVNELFCSGDANRGVQTAAYNLPNDERIAKEKGTKRVMLKNVQEAKFKRGAAAHRQGGAVAGRQKNVALRRLLHPHPHARADARPRAAQHHRRRARRPRCGRSCRRPTAPSRRPRPTSPGSWRCST